MVNVRVEGLPAGGYRSILFMTKGQRWTGNESVGVSRKNVTMSEVIPRWLPCCRSTIMGIVLLLLLVRKVLRNWIWLNPGPLSGSFYDPLIPIPYSLAVLTQPHVR